MRSRTQQSGDAGGEMVVVVDPEGNPAGTADKLAAHRPPGTPHLAFSVFLFDRAGRILLQRRSTQKYHFAGLWSNSCCSHPPAGAAITEAAERRVGEELGARSTALEVAGCFWYRARDEVSGLVEHEYDVVLRGLCVGDLDPDPAEVGDVAWLEIDSARLLCERSPAQVTPWFAAALEIATGTPPAGAVTAP